MPAKSRTKGRRAEQEIVNLAKAAGLEASREWANAQHPDPAMRACDVLVAGKRAQVKVMASGYARLYAGLEGVELLFVRRGHSEWLIVLRAGDYLNLLQERK